MNHIKENRYENLLLGLGVIFFALCMIIPNSGKFVLLDELFNALAFWGLFFCFIMKVVIRKVKSNFIRLVIVLFALFNIFITSKILLDVKDGSTYIKLSNISLTKRISSRVFSIKYYVQGIDEKGQRHIFLVSEDDINLIKHANEVYLEYYPHTERVLRVSTTDISDTYMMLEYSRYSINEQDEEYTNYYFIKLSSDKKITIGHINDEKYRTIFMTDADYDKLMKLINSKEANITDNSGTDSSDLEYISLFDRFGNSTGGIGLNHSLFLDIKNILFRYVD